MNYYEGDNIGSIAELQAAFFNEFESFNPAVLATGKTWLDVPFKEQSGVLYLKTEETDNGMLYTYSGKFTIHNWRDEVEEAMFTLLGQRSVLKITDFNGRVHVIGSPDNPVTLTLNASTGQQYTDENGQEFSFKIEQIKPSLRA